jgi:hypothetical protein
MKWYFRTADGGVGMGRPARPAGRGAVP